jgi:hypothetical protein
MIMSTNTCLSLALAVCMGLVSAPLFAEVTPAPESTVNSNNSGVLATEHQDAAALKKQDAKHDEATANYRKWSEAETEQSGHIGYAFFSAASPEVIA